MELPLISCIQKLVLYETKAVSFDSKPLVPNSVIIVKTLIRPDKFRIFCRVLRDHFPAFP